LCESVSHMKAVSVSRKRPPRRFFLLDPGLLGKSAFQFRGTVVLLAEISASASQEMALFFFSPAGRPAFSRFFGAGGLPHPLLRTHRSLLISCLWLLLSRVGNAWLRLGKAPPFPSCLLSGMFLLFDGAFLLVVLRFDYRLAEIFRADERCSPPFCWNAQYPYVFPPFRRFPSSLFVLFSSDITIAFETQGVQSDLSIGWAKTLPPFPFLVMAGVNFFQGFFFS